MKRSVFLVLAVGGLLLAAAAGSALAAGHSVAIPKGTKCEKLGPGSFKLTTPDGVVFSVTSSQKAGKGTAIPGAAGILGDCGIKDANGKLIASGKHGVLKAATGKAVKGAPPADYVKVDDEVTRLPAIIEFPELRIFNRPALNKLSPQPDPPGKG